jgi:quercetin dioxygenase-like cupin family protein
MPDFVIQDWRLEADDGDQAPPHVHHAGDEGFVCLDGDLEVTIDGTRTSVPPGGFVLVSRGRVHTFASHGGGHVLAVMSPEIADLIDGLHADLDDEQRLTLWERCHSSLVEG